MKLRWLFSSALVLLAAFHPVRARIAFVPEEGEETYRSFSVALTFGLEDLAMRVNDQEMPFGMGQFDPTDIEGEVTYDLEVVDRFTAVADGRATRIERRFETVETAYEVFEDSGEETMEELEGETVVFTWNAEDEDYDREWGEDSDGDRDELEPLAADLDLLALLPPDDVEEGDSWEVPASALSGLLLPGIDFERAGESDIEGMDDVPVELIAPLREAMEETMLELTFVGLRGGDGGELALIELSFSSEVSIDISDVLAERMADQDEVEADVDAFTLDLYLDLEGELLWDLAKGRFSSFEIDGDLAVDMYAEATMRMGGPDSIPIEVEGELSGEISIEGTTVR